jgi:hypothetical protein
MSSNSCSTCYPHSIDLRNLNPGENGLPEIKSKIHHADTTTNIQPGLHGFEYILVMGVFAELFDYFIHIGFGILNGKIQSALE